MIKIKILKEVTKKTIKCERCKMKVYGAFKFFPFGKEELVGLAKTQKKAMSLLRREFPHMRGSLAGNDLTSDVNNTYLLDIRELEVEEYVIGCQK